MKTCACIVHRNKQSKEVIEEAFAERIQSQDHFCCDVGFKVFTVSSKEFRDPDKLSDAELTEIPALRELLRDLNASFPERREEEYIKEAEGVLSLIQGSKCDSHTDAEMKNTKRQAYRKLKETLTANLSEALRGLRGKYNALENCLSQAAKESEANCLQNAEKKVIDPTDREKASGYHKTLRAMCVKGGVTISKNNGKVTDLNAVLVSHMEQKVNQTFKDVFERRSSRQTQSVAAILQKFDLTSRITKEFKHPVTLILTFIATQQDKRKTALDKDITQMRKEIYICLRDTIESAMDPVYREAASHTGPGSYTEMQEVLREGIRKLKSTMFTQAMLNALEKFDNMEDHIEKTLKELQDIAAKALSQKHSMPLPDVSDEMKMMKTLRAERKRRP
ncbi:hypothetical protein AALO_G00283320 [Alosa alosa]|uniref:DUF7605 domain-containing protein n=1 Tax=Alosa alosa TaxID=278164 RepID=A0AAV6FNS1_9TELE|nr:nuclear GTPase SLIP-GC-like [Alosa alosa]KAG5263166.1 hypothetical protein AALO_G00283320 [Alosa alosa]